MWNLCSWLAIAKMNFTILTDLSLPPSLKIDQQAHPAPGASIMRDIAINQKGNVSKKKKKGGGGSLYDCMT